MSTTDPQGKDAPATQPEEAHPDEPSTTHAEEAPATQPDEAREDDEVPATQPEEAHPDEPSTTHADEAPATQPEEAHQQEDVAPATQPEEAHPGEIPPLADNEYAITHMKYHHKHYYCRNADGEEWSCRKCNTQGIPDEFRKQLREPENEWLEAPPGNSRGPRRWEVLEDVGEERMETDPTEAVVAETVVADFATTSQCATTPQWARDPVKFLDEERMESDPTEAVVAETVVADSATTSQCATTPQWGRVHIKFLDEEKNCARNALFNLVHPTEEQVELFNQLRVAKVGMTPEYITLSQMAFHASSVFPDVQLRRVKDDNPVDLDFFLESKGGRFVAQVIRSGGSINHVIAIDCDAQVIIDCDPSYEYPLPLTHKTFAQLDIQGVHRARQVVRHPLSQKNKRSRKRKAAVADLATGGADMAGADMAGADVVGNKRNKTFSVL